MPMAYFKCACGKEQRKIVPIDKTGYIPNKRGGFTFDPNAPKVPEKKHTVVCDCGETVTQTDDPQAVRSFLQLNWLES